MLALLILGCEEKTTKPSGLRVVSLHDVTTEIVVALAAETPGLLDRLVGVAPPVDLAPAAAAATAKTTRADGTESVVALAPTVVLGMKVVEERSPVLVRLLRERGVDVHLGAPRTLPEVVTLVEEVAARVGARPAGARLAAKLRAQIPAPTPTARGLRVFVYDCCDPAFTAGGGGVLNDLIARAGGENVFADLAPAWTKVAWESVLARRPEMIVINNYAYEGQADLAGKRAVLARLPGLDRPDVVMPLGEALGGLRSFDGLARLQRAFAASPRPAVAERAR